MDTYTILMLESMNFLQLLTLLLVALLFGKDTVLPWISEKFFGAKRPDVISSPDPAKRIEGKMDALQFHFNHETTELLTAIKDNTSEITRKLAEFEKYGIPCRDPK